MCFVIAMNSELFKDNGLDNKSFSLILDNVHANDSMQIILKRKLQKDLARDGDFFVQRLYVQVIYEQSFYNIFVNTVLFVF